MEIKNNLTVPRGEGEGRLQEKEGEALSKNPYKGPMDKPNGVGLRVEGGGWLVGWVRALWGIMDTIVLE